MKQLRNSKFQVVRDGGVLGGVIILPCCGLKAALLYVHELAQLFIVWPTQPWPKTDVFPGASIPPPPPLPPPPFPHAPPPSPPENSGLMAPGLSPDGDDPVIM